MRYKGENREGYERDVYILADAWMLQPLTYAEMCDEARRIAEDYVIPNEIDVYADVTEARNVLSA